MPDLGQIELSKLRDQLAQLGSAYLKAVMIRSGDSWQLRYLSAVIGFEPPGWSYEIWQYEEMLLVSDAMLAPQLSILTESEEGGPGGGEERKIVVRGITATIPPVFDSAPWYQRPSFFRTDRAPLPRSSCDIQLNSPVITQLQLPPGLQVGRDDAPSLPSAEAVCDAFLHGRYSLSSTAQLPSCLATLRIVGNDAWIGPVRIEATRMTVEVNGRRSVGASLELSAPGGSQTYDVGPDRTVSIPLPDGPARQAWLWLKVGTEWMDYRALSEPDDPHWRATAGVEIDVPVEPAAAIEALIAGGEGPYLELKGVLPTDADSRRKTFKTVAAFANASGGTVIVGVDRDEMTLLGVEGDATQLRDQLSSMVRSSVIPTPPFQVDHHLIDGKGLLVLRVEPGPSPPYGLVADKGSRDRPEYYVRRGASTFPAQPSDIREAVMAQVPLQRTSTGIGNVFESL